MKEISILLVVVLTGYCANPTYTFFSNDDIDLILEHGGTNEKAIEVYHNDILVDDPTTDGPDVFDEVKFEYSGAKGYLNFGGPNLMRFNHGHVGSMGNFLQPMPKIEIPGVMEMGGGVADQLLVYTEERAEYGYHDFKTRRWYIDEKSEARGDTVAVGESYIKFKEIIRTNAEGLTCFDVEITYTFTMLKDAEVQPVFQVLKGSYNTEGVTDHETFVWDTPNGTVQSFDVAEEDWILTGEPTYKMFEIGSFYEMHSLGKSWKGRNNDNPPRWRITVLDASGVAEGQPLFLKMANNGVRSRAGEGSNISIRFSPDEYLSLKAGDSFSATIAVTNDASAFPWKEVYHYGFEDSLELWELTNTEYLPDGATWLEFLYNDQSIIKTSAGNEFTPSREAEGVAAIKMVSTGTEDSTIAEMTNPIKAAGASQVRLSYWFKTIDFDSDDTLFVEFFDGSKWEVIEKIVVDYPVCAEPYTTNNFVRHSYAYAKSDEVSITNESRFRFRLAGKTAGHHVYIDDLDFYTKYDNTEPTTFVDLVDFNVASGDKTIEIFPLRNDNDFNGDEIKISSVTSSNMGNSVLMTSDSTVSYTINSMSLGTDILYYTVQNSETSTTGKIVVNLTSFNGGSNIYQAEEATLVNCTIEAPYIEFNDGEGNSYLEYTVWVPKDEEYDLTFYTQAGSAKPQLISIDGNEGQQMSFGGGDGWGFPVTTVYAVFLTKGIHTIRVIPKNKTPQHDKLIITGPVDDWGTLDGDNQVVVHPNTKIGNSLPAFQVRAGKLFISGPVNQVENIYIYTLRGQRIAIPLQSLKLLKEGSAISLSHLSRGMYLMQVETTKGVLNHKFIR